MALEACPLAWGREERREGRRRRRGDPATKTNASPVLPATPFETSGCRSTNETATPARARDE